MKLALSPILKLSLGTVGYFCFTNQALAQVNPDGTVNTQVNQNGNVAEITGGEARGDNLFHSFQDFSVTTGNEAFFDNANDISNIFSRVTGGNTSIVDGLIRANGNASLFLINPAGIIFGNDASLDIGGSFYGSTADSILFEDGEFSAVNNLNAPALTINAPIGLNLRDNPSRIVNLSFAQNSDGDFVGLEVFSGETLALIGGDIIFDAGEATARGGDIYLGGLANAGTVSIESNGNLTFPESVARANVSFSNAADLDVRSTGNGSISINANDVEILGSSLQAGIAANSTSPEVQSGDINLNATGAVNLDGGSTVLNTVDFGGTGNAGNINITADSLSISDGGSLNSNTSGEGNAGDILLDIANNIELTDSNIFSQVGVTGVGDGGIITIETANLSLFAGSQIGTGVSGRGNAGSVTINASDTVTFQGTNSIGLVSGIINNVTNGGIGNAGDIEINTANLNLIDGGTLDSSVFGEGNGGLVRVNSSNSVNISGFTALNEDITQFSGINTAISPESVGDAGNIEINSGSLSLSDGGFLNSSTFGEGDGGNINIQTEERIAISGEDSSIFSNVEEDAIGNAGTINLETRSLFLDNNGELNNSTNGEGNAGAINIIAEEVSLVNGEVSTEVDEDGEGNAGTINLETRSLFIADEAELNSSTNGEGDGGDISITADEVSLVNGEISTAVESGAVGNGGNINVDTRTFSLIEGGQIFASVLGATDELPAGIGNGGSININALDLLEISGIDEESLASGLFANTAEGINGDAGNISIATTDLNISNNGIINVDSLGTGNGGNVAIDAESLKLERNASISSTANFGRGGNADIQILNNLILRNNSEITVGAFGEANGGNVSIDAGFIIAFPSQVPNNGNDILASAEEGQGGNITISTQAILGIEERRSSSANGTNDIDASREFGLEGFVSDDFSVDVGFSGNINLIDTEQTTAQACQANRESAAENGFTIEGKGGILPEPGLPLNSLNILIDGENNPTSAIPQAVKTSHGKIQPARGVQVTENGEIILTAYRTNNQGDRLTESKLNCGV